MSSAEIARLRAEAAAAAEAAAQARAEVAAARAAAAQAALDAALAAGTEPGSADAGPAATQPPAVPPSPPAPTHRATIRDGYSFAGPALPLGALLVDGTPDAGVQVGIPLRSFNRHGLVAGATGTGKTRTLQLLAEGLSANGVPVFLTDIKGDLTGLAEAGTPSEQLLARTAALGQDWAPASFPVELFSLGGAGAGIPIRTTVTDFGPLLLSRVLGLNDTQESALALIFHWADQQGLALLDLKDLRSTIAYLTNDEGKPELKAIGGVSSATAGVILREIAALQAQGADAFFGEPAFSTSDLMRTSADGRGVISALELPQLSDQPALFSTFVMWLLADLFEELPEVGDPDKPRLVFFFDEAHLLFAGASREFLSQVVQTVRLIRSKGVGVFFVTQTPKDVPEDVLAQLGSRVQHALRAYTPRDQQRLAQSARTFPVSPYDLEELLTMLGTGEAVVTVLSESGAPTPVAPTRLRAPQAAMGPASPPAVDAIVAGSTLQRYRSAVDNESAFEMLTTRMERQRAERSHAEDDARRAALEEAERRRQQRDAERARDSRRDTMDALLTSAARTIGREITRSIFGTRRR